MLLVRHVLVALDAGDNDRRAVDAATAAALGAGGRVTLLLPRTPGALRRLAAFAAAESLSPADAAEVYLDRLAAEVALWGVEVDAVTTPAVDDAHEVAAQAERLGADLVLVPTGPHGRRAGRRDLAQRIVRVASAPVVTAPPPTTAPALDDRVA